LVGISGIFGQVENPGYSLQLIKNIHKVDSLPMESFEVIDNNFLSTIIMRKELADTPENFLWKYNDYFVLIDGYICPDEQTIEPHPIYVIKNWLLYGKEFIKNLNGEYNICIYNRIKKSCIIFNDRFASRNLFISKKNNKLYFGSEIKSILVHLNKAPEICNEGLLEFFAFSHNLKNNTIFNGITAITPASIIEITNNSFQLNNYWQLNFKYEDFNKKTAPEEMASALYKAAKKRYTGKKKIGLGLSGGLDSRVIAVTIPKDVRPIFARTYGSKDSIEVKVASDLARVLEFNHYIHTPKEVLFSSFLYPSVWRTECSVHFTGLKSIVEHYNLKDQVLYNLGGQFGDVLTGKQLRPFMFFKYKKEDFINRIFEHYTSYTYKNINKLKQVFEDNFFKNSIARLIENFKKSFLEIEAENNADLYDIWDLKNRQARFTFSSGRVDNYIFQKIKLFTDYYYVDTALKVPPIHRFGQNLYKKMIATQFPEISFIPNANTRKKIKKSYISNTFDLVNQYMFKSSRINSNNDEASKRNMFIKDIKLKEIIESFIKDSSFPSQIFSSKGITDIVNDHYSLRKNNEYLLGVLLTFIASYNLFFLNRYNSIPDKANPFTIK